MKVAFHHMRLWDWQAAQRADIVIANSKEVQRRIAKYYHRQVPVILLGAGIKPGVAHGRSDDWGYQAVENKTWCYDLHATVLHLLGIDHLRLTVRQNGIDRRLTDVHGHVVKEILA